MYLQLIVYYLILEYYLKINNVIKFPYHDEKLIINNLVKYKILDFTFNLEPLKNNSGHTN